MTVVEGVCAVSVPLVTTADGLAAAGTAATTSRPPAAPEGDFAAALAAATETSPTGAGTAPDPAQQASVPLGEMVAAYAAAPGLGAPPAPALPGGDGGAFGAPAVGGVQAAGAAAGATGAATAGGGHPALTAGEQYLGVPYQWGGTSPDTGFDCSGFVQRAFADIGVSLPRVSVDQARAGQPVASMDQARPGDLVFWNGDGSRPNHIGIYAGNGEMLVAPSTGDVVRYQGITREPHAIRRVT
jgi:peptidoglycan DL-endopeptidase CwlO